MSSSYLEIAVCASMFLIHAWILLGHREKMGAGGGDDSKDPFFRKGVRIATFTFAFALTGAGLWRRALIATDPIGTHLVLVPANAWTLWSGAAVFAAGLWLRVWAIRTLGRFFTFEIGIRSGHRIVRAGPYRWLRHPSYTGYFLLILGIALSYATIIGLVLSVAIPVGFWIFRIRHEERMLAAHFGAEYEGYRRETWRLVPWVF